MAAPRIALPESVLALVGKEAEIPEKQSRGTDHPHTSNSQLTTYLRCSMQYFFAYILKLRQRPKVSMSIGSGGHAALEWNAKKKIETGVDQPIDEVVQKAEDFMYAYLRELPYSEYEKDVEPGQLVDKYLAATKVFRTRDAPKITPIAAEMSFSLDLNPYLPPDEEPIRVVEGFIDIISTDRDLFIAPPEITPIDVRDYKFAGRRKNQNEVNLSTQLTLYNTVVKQVTGKWPSKSGLTVLTPGNTKDGPDATALMREAAYMTPEAQESRLRRLVFQFRRLEHAIKNQVWIPTDDPITCSWCGYRDRCQDSLVNDFEAAILRGKTAPPPTV